MSDEPKYRQRGYKDTGDRGSQSSRGPQAPREKKDGPRGRGLGAPSDNVFRCARCGEKQPLFDEVPVDATCMSCGKDLHTCTNCVSFDTSVRWECRRFEEVPAKILKKSTRNECPLFVPKVAQEFAKDSNKGNPGDALFKF